MLGFSEPRHGVGGPERPKCGLAVLSYSILNLDLVRMFRVLALAHICNPTYQGGRGQGDHTSRPGQGNSSPKN
jgi:hypothetical protein